MNTYFMPDNSEFRADNINSLQDFFKEREDSSVWFTDDDNTRAEDIRFQPINAEPICIPVNVSKLRQSKMPKFTSSEEAYADTMDEPDYGYFGSSQMIFVNGNLYPVGNSAIKGLIDRAGIRAEGWEKLKKFNPSDLSEVLNRCMRATKGFVCVLAQDEKVRAVNSGRYAICPMSFVATTTDEWIKSERPQAIFDSSYVCHDYATWTIDLSHYTDEVLGQFPELKQNGFTPSLIVSLSNTGTASVSLRPALTINHKTFPLANSIDCTHIGKGSAAERTSQMRTTVKNNFMSVFPELQKSVEEIYKMRNTKVSNAYNALLRGMKSLGLPKEQAMESAEQFKFLYPASATAYDCYIAIVDVFTFVVRDNPMDYKKQFNVADAVGRSIKFDWAKLGNIPGEFSW